MLQVFAKRYLISCDFSAGVLLRGFNLEGRLQGKGTKNEEKPQTKRTHDGPARIFRPPEMLSEAPNQVNGK